MRFCALFFAMLGNAAFGAWLHGLGVQNPVGPLVAGALTLVSTRLILKAWAR